MSHLEVHKSHRIGWLRAAVLGANDGIVSTSSLIIGFAAAQTSRDEILLAGIAGMVAGAMSMATGEFVSVSSQADTEKADLKIEKKSIENDYEHEVEELASIYQERGLDSDLAHQVAQQLMAHDALDAHARDELGIFDRSRAKPFEAAFSSAGMFTLGAALPLMTAYLAPDSRIIGMVSVLSLFFLATLGSVAAKAGGASVWKGALRITFWSALAMFFTAMVGQLFGLTTT